MNKQVIPVITIDGASGTGKGVVTHKVAELLGWHLLDSGVLYRVLGLAAASEGVAIDFEHAERVGQLARELDVRFVTPPQGILPRIFLGTIDVTETIRTENIGNLASKAGALPIVREALLARQRAFRLPPGLVTDGRDMGTVVFPDAEVKIFLTASLTERARRRYLQLKAQGVDVTLGALEEELDIRDKRDQSRAVAPLKPAADAICIDTDPLTISEVVELVMIVAEKKGYKAG